MADDLDSPDGRGRGPARRCALHENATQVVMGEGPRDAPLMVVGEQPGDQEDLAGPALRRSRRAALRPRSPTRSGSTASAAFVTNAVKHFKFTPRGKRRIHQRPDAGEVTGLPMVARGRAPDSCGRN